MQNLYPSSKSEDVDHGLSNGLHRAYAHVSKAVSTSSSSSSPSRHGGLTSSGNKVPSSEHLEKIFIDFKLSFGPQNKVLIAGSSLCTLIAEAKQLTTHDLSFYSAIICDY